MRVLTSAARCAVGTGLLLAVAVVSGCGGSNGAASSSASGSAPATSASETSATAPTSVAPTSAAPTSAAPSSAAPTSPAPSPAATTSTPTGGAEKGVLSSAARRVLDSGSVRYATTVLTTPTGAAAVTVSTTGLQDFTHRRAVAFVTSPGSGRTETRVIGTTVYVKVPRGTAGGAKPWVKTDVATLGLGTSLDPSASLAYLDATISGLRDLGAVTIGGVRTTHYSATVDLVKALGPSAKGPLGAQLRKAGATTGHLDAYLDAEGRYRRLSQTYTLRTFPSATGKTGPATIASRQDYTDFGVAVAVTAPPASQVGPLGGRKPA